MGRGLGLVLLALLPSAWAFFQSAPECGIDSSGFVKFEQDPRASEPWGVCDWGITQYTTTKANNYAGKCLRCYPTSALDPQCKPGWKLNKQEEWWLAPKAKCQWSLGCLDVPCPDGSVEADMAACGSGGVARLCCPKRLHNLCCQVMVFERCFKAAVRGLRAHQFLFFFRRL